MHQNAIKAARDSAAWWRKLAALPAPVELAFVENADPACYWAFANRKRGCQRCPVYRQTHKPECLGTPRVNAARLARQILDDFQLFRRAAELVVRSREQALPPRKAQKKAKKTLPAPGRPGKFLPVPKSGTPPTLPAGNSSTCVPPGRQ